MVVADSLLAPWRFSLFQCHVWGVETIAEMGRPDICTPSLSKGPMLPSTQAWPLRQHWLVPIPPTLTDDFFFGLREFCPLFFQLLLQIYIIISSTNARNRQASGHFYFWPHCTKLPHGRETHKDSATVINLGTKTFKKEKTPTLTFREIILSHREGSVWHL